jgi:cell division septum initiation protein DivIVA
MADVREKFATQVDPTLLASVRGLAQKEGRQLQALVEEALTDLLEKRKHTRARAHVMAAYQGSHEKYAELYKILAR